MDRFELVSDFAPAGDQPKAIKELSSGVKAKGQQTLLGVTGSGKTFTVSHVIANANKPTLVLCHNKTLAAQLFNEFKGFFPKNEVHYFVSYYDYYQPESYLPGKDVYIEKDAQINEKIEQLRLAATSALLSRRDVIIVSSVSCIYGLGDPKNWRDLSIELKKGQEISREKLIAGLVDLQFERNDLDLSPGNIRVRGNIVDIRATMQDNFLRIEFFGDQVEKISKMSLLNVTEIEALDSALVFPAKHFVVKEDQRFVAVKTIREELMQRLPELAELERQRLESRTRYDLEMIEELGYCSGIENYSRHFDGRKPGEPPHTLLDFFPDDFLLVVDESHVTLPQVSGMVKGDRSRKKSLIDNGFRLPSAYDNRPLDFQEFEKYLKNVIYVSATPADYEISHSKKVVEQIIRPTGLVDPSIEVRPTRGQIEDLLKEIRATEKKGFRTLVTALTKKMAEDLAEFLAKEGVKARYLHSEIDTLERTEIIRQLRLKKFDCLVGINLLREGLDIPEVALVAILDADKEGFLRNARSLVQTTGRAARNSEGRVIMYAEHVTDSMRRAIGETDRRRRLQVDFNKKHGIVPKTIVKKISEEQIAELSDVDSVPSSNIPELLVELESQMNLAAEKLEFEKAIVLRDKIMGLEKRLKGKK
ncbi:MAG: excinuclease ABC subunit UvrB [Candidatus Diapherotrites archaeon]|nr:excinuclease ABC subunit UvrB [Candidatus Diapherotrites archaeon]